MAEIRVMFTAVKRYGYLVEVDGGHAASDDALVSEDDARETARHAAYTVIDRLIDEADFAEE